MRDEQMNDFFEEFRVQCCTQPLSPLCFLCLLQFKDGHHHFIDEREVLRGVEFLAVVILSILHIQPPMQVILYPPMLSFVMHYNFCVPAEGGYEIMVLHSCLPCALHGALSADDPKGAYTWPFIVYLPQTTHLGAEKAPAAHQPAV